MNFFKLNSMKNKLEKVMLDSMRTDPGNWKGPFYFNPRDRRLLVPKYNPYMGWTFNFASPWSWITFIAIILIVILFS